jgi:hypothetical protein
MNFACCRAKLTAWVLLNFVVRQSSTARSGLASFGGRDRGADVGVADTRLRPGATPAQVQARPGVSGLRRATNGEGRPSDALVGPNRRPASRWPNETSSASMTPWYGPNTSGRRSSGKGSGGVSAFPSSATSRRRLGDCSMPRRARGERSPLGWALAEMPLPSRWKRFVARALASKRTSAPTPVARDGASEGWPGHRHKSSSGGKLDVARVALVRRDSRHEGC